VSYAACTTCAPLDGMSEEDRYQFERMAVEYLWAWTLNAFGVCRETLRSCRSDCWALESKDPLSPALVGGQWFNLTCGLCGDNCSCSAPAALRLPGPVVSIDEILIDGAVLPPTAYRVDNQSLLVRMDGGFWPRCQNMSLPPSVPGTWQIAYQRGREVPVGGQIAAGIMACELAKAACRDGTCALPQRIQTITRQGVTMAMVDPFEGLDNGRTGIWLVDSWVASITTPVRAAKVYSPDVPRPKWRKRTTVPPSPE
jgi:hypothetical protein